MIGKEFYSLNAAKQYKSKTRAYPFIIAHECYKPYTNKKTGESAVKTREFFAFNDIEEFLANRNSFPYAHEVIFDRISDKQQGRLVFDFDFDEPWHGLAPTYVPPDFQQNIEKLIITTFDEYYLDVDTKRLTFVWLKSNTTTKWSKHLVVKNAYFGYDWKEQIQIFYNLMLGIAHEKKIFKLDTAKLIDIQVARTNATMRMCGSCKYGRDNILTLEDPNFSIYDSFVQLYRRCDVQEEQHIMEGNLSKKHLNKIFFEQYETKIVNNDYYKKCCDLANIDLTKLDKRYSSDELEQDKLEFALTCLSEYYELKYKQEMPFKFKNVLGCIINLDRKCSAKCLISERVHDNENAFLTVQQDGGIYFHCRRGCSQNGKQYLKIYQPLFTNSDIDN